MLKALGRSAATLAVTAAAILTASPASAQVSGCGYGTGGAYDSTICWIDMSGFDQTLAMSPVGQPMSIELTSQYSMSFTFKFTPGADGYRVLEPTAFPTYSQAPIGNTAYIGTPGQPALYQQVNAGTGASGDLGTLTIENLTVTGPSGRAVDGYGIVMADAETTNREEGLGFTSDQPIEQLTEATMPGALPACGQELSGLGTTSVTCKGDSAGGLAVNEIVLYSDSPSTASISFLDRTDNAVQGVAFGILTAKVGMSKTIEDKTAGTDSFSLSIEDGSGNLVGEASTDGGDSAAIESTTVLADSGRPFVFTEAAEGGTDMSTYTQAWSCTNHGEADDALPGGDGVSQEISVGIGDDVACAVTNTGTPPDVPSAGPSTPSTADDDAVLPQTGVSMPVIVVIAVASLAALAAGGLMFRRGRSTGSHWGSA